MSDGTPPAVDAPQLRTLLLTDLCDSTGLVEKLGDAGAAAFFREHDHFVLELQQRWRGRLIDRSDGLLLMFERPLDGLGFALDYRRGLEDLGWAHGAVPLRARAGIHVGEVLIWRNSDEAVQAGAKSMEIEGLAKPLAARLMQLARPGQILLSAVAEPLVRRAARELGERGDALQWRSHGRWRFKGVPEVQEVLEVGEPGLAPLRAPSGDAKARRDLPLWRRPAALVAEVLLVAGIGLGAWFITRPEPAIAFSERDWVVVGDLRNLTGQTVLDESLEQAFRISLEQSRYVNVLSDLKVQQTLEQMRLDPQSAMLDRAVASQVAARTGARAVVLPAVNEVDNELQFSVEIVDPVTQTTIYSERASGKGLASVLGSIDKVSRQLRGNLGEAVASVQQSSIPLPQATTGNLEALRAYALAEEAMAKRSWEEARGLFESAVRLDPEFARAHLGLASIAWASGDTADASRHVANAVRVREKLTARDQLQVDAWQAEISPDGGSLSQWLTMAKLYPDHYPAQSNASWYLLAENRFEEALAHAQQGSAPQAPKRTYTLVHVARALTALGRAKEALEALEQAELAGRAPMAGARAEALILQGRPEQAAALLEAVKPEDGLPMWLNAQRGLVAVALDGDDGARAKRLALRMREMASSLPAPYPRHFTLNDLIVRSATGEAIPMESLAAIEREARKALMDAGSPARYEEVFRYAVLAYLAQRSGQVALASRCLDWLEPEALRMRNRQVDKIVTLVRANQLRLDGRVADGVELLKPQLDGTELVQARVVMRELARDGGDLSGIAEQERWLHEHHGQALAEVVAEQVLQPLNLVDVRTEISPEATGVR
ncbi:putative peptide modification system cyclase [Pseudoxanthomonas sp.]|uniref:putative peptide modification system cyclase n=1 Tax=Pseudoxanthomonas sp. TaxID=1871049 RepID=UPI00258B86B6|nr:putative peptide modification system cyclase [Pseudoxanthomonas sp.]MCR6685955.1 putative peptide modification system cyclase [Pseudoxanthomonas sp.]